MLNKNISKKYYLLLFACFLLLVETKAQDNEDLKVIEIELIANKTKGGAWETVIFKQKNFNKYFEMEALGDDFLVVVDKKTQTFYTGKIKVIYPSGGTFCVWSYLDGLMNGEQRMYYENGNLQNESVMSYDLLHGRYKSYDEDGTPVKDKTYKDGFLNGPYVHYENGIKKAEGEMLELVDKEFYGDEKIRRFQTGYWTYYFKNGKIECEGKFVSDKALEDSVRVGMWKYYNEDGTLRISRMHDEGKHD